MLEWRSVVAHNTNRQPSRPCRGRDREIQAASERMVQKNTKWPNEKQRGWERERVCDSTQTAIRFHHSFKHYCWISECLFTLSAHERERRRQKKKEEMWEWAGKNDCLLLKQHLLFPFLPFCKLHCCNYFIFPFLLCHYLPLDLVFRS